MEYDNTNRGTLYRNENKKEENHLRILTNHTRIKIIIRLTFKDHKISFKIKKLLMKTHFTL